MNAHLDKMFRWFEIASWLKTVQLAKLMLHLDKDRIFLQEEKYLNNWWYRLLLLLGSLLAGQSFNLLKINFILYIQVKDWPVHTMYHSFMMLHTLKSKSLWYLYWMWWSLSLAPNSSHLELLCIIFQMFLEIPLQCHCTNYDRI